MLNKLFLNYFFACDFRVMGKLKITFIQSLDLQRDVFVAWRPIWRTDSFSFVAGAKSIRFVPRILNVVVATLLRDAQKKLKSVQLINQNKFFLRIVSFSDFESLDEDTQVVATARGKFTSQGGVLSSPESGVSIVIPEGAIPPGVEQEIYFKVCKDNNFMPPLDSDRGKDIKVFKGYVS